MTDEQLIGVTMPGKHRRQRHDHRRKDPKPPAEPLMLFFTLVQLRSLRCAVDRAIHKLAPRRREKHSRDGGIRCPICAPCRCSEAP
jgi:hypothetical protein